MSEPPERSEAVDGDEPPAPEPPAPPPGRPGLRTFTIEGRAAPGLFVLGWVASVLGFGLVVVGLAAAGSPVIVVIGLAFLTIGLVAAGGSQAIERHAHGDRAYRGPSPILVFGATVAGSFLAAALIGGLLSSLGFRAQTPLANLILITIQAVVSITIVGILVVGTRSLRWSEIGFHRRAADALAELAYGAAFAVPVIGATAVVAALLSTVLNVVPESPLPPTGEATGLLLNLLAGAIVAPISEEILFRGVATTAWVRTSGVRSGIVRAALFFAVAHVLGITGGSLQEALSLAIVGFASRVPVALVLGWVYVRRKSIYASIGLHAAFNAILLVAADAAVRAGAAG